MRADQVLIIIDMQQGMQATHLPARNNPAAEAQIASLLSAWRRHDWPIVHVRHLSRSPQSVFWPGQAGVLFQAPFMPATGGPVFDKQTPDAFCQTRLEHWLHQRGLRRLLIVGVSTNHSVESTARRAGNLGFDTEVVADACFTFAQTDCAGAVHSAEDVHTMALSNLQAEYARVVLTQEVLARTG